MEPVKDEKTRPLARRDFFKRTTAATAGVLLVKPETAFGSASSSALKLGIVGCGGRGTEVAGSFVENTNTVVTALADVFQDQIDRARNHFDHLQSGRNLPGVSKTFLGPRSFEELVASDVDVVLISTPTCFHPEQLQAAVEAGKHVYLEKPVATDVYGCKKVLELAHRADGRLSVDVGFQIRRGTHFRELARRLRQGAVGEIVLCQGYYFSGDLPRRAKPGMSRQEAMLRDWFFYRNLSGDILVEQNVHIIDMFNWILGAHPVRAEATGGRRVRTDVGDVWDHYVVTYYYPNDVRASFTSTQFLPSWGDVCARFFGSGGFGEACYVGGVRIRGEHDWEAGADEVPVGTTPEVDPLVDATPEKVKAFERSIRSGSYHNELVQGAESTLSGILGRQAAYEKVPMTWTTLLASDQRWDPGIDLGRLG